MVGCMCCKAHVIWTPAPPPPSTLHEAWGRHCNIDRASREAYRVFSGNGINVGGRSGGRPG